ncbi:MAG: hypothetical protein K2P80_14530 [Beijerinckiaceae bacterium]|nr:hypothetical protein [Beijerinckiaceae bacterium]
MAVMEDAPPTPGWEMYTGDRKTAGPFENRILYAMCRDNPAHGDAYVTAGKITAIGRIYAAAPERGAGSGRETGLLADAIAARLVNSPLDEGLQAIAISDGFSESNRAQVVAAHQLLVDEIAIATFGWSKSFDNEGWLPRTQGSFASKYLHFHRPNAFPIMDSYAKAGLVCVGLNGPFDTYELFCAGFARHVEKRVAGWTPRSIDTALVIRGRAHQDRTSTSCRACGTAFVRRQRKKKSAGNGG